MSRLGYNSALKPARSIDYEAIKRNALKDQSILVVHIDDHRLSWPEKELLRQIGEKIYGRAAENSNGRSR